MYLHSVLPLHAGLEQGLEEDFLVAVELGATSRDELSEAQLQYVDKIKEKLLQVLAPAALPKVLCPVLAQPSRACLFYYSIAVWRLSATWWQPAVCPSSMILC